VQALKNGAAKAVADTPRDSAVACSGRRLTMTVRGTWTRWNTWRNFPTGTIKLLVGIADVGRHRFPRVRPLTARAGAESTSVYNRRDDVPDAAAGVVHGHDIVAGRAGSRVGGGGVVHSGERGGGFAMKLIAR